MSVLGVGDGLGREFVYRSEPGGAFEHTGTSITDHTDVFTCACNQCGAGVEAIFQPIGRSMCEIIGADPVPCQPEYEACMEANPDPEGISSGTTADGDLLYVPIFGTPLIPSTSVCQPEKAFGAYKVGYNLTVRSRL
eukprot:SAG11_NODE_1715_length_4396_cov_3.282290_6_plen_137_part_00